MKQYELKPNEQYDITALLKEDEQNIENEINSIEQQIALRERIKLRNVDFLEHQRRKIEKQINKTQCFEYNPQAGVGAVRNGLTTQMVQVDLKKGEEYNNCFRDIQRLEEQKRNLLTQKEDSVGFA